MGWRETQLLLTLFTSDNDEVWRAQLERQRAEMDRISRNKADTDRGAAYARQMTGLPPAPASNHLQQPGPTRSNAFDRILNNATSSSQMANQYPDTPASAHNQSYSSNLATRPRATTNTTHNSQGGAGSSTTSAVKQEPASERYKIPGAYYESDSELEDVMSPTDFLFNHATQQPQPSFPTLPPLPIPNYFNNSGSTIGPMGFGLDNSFRQLPSFPALDLGRQASPSSTASLSSMTPFMDLPGNYNQYPNGTLYGGDRPGSLNNGVYYPSGGSSSLAATINRVSHYDFNSMLDADGNALSSRLVNFLDDYVHDPRKTEEEIQQLLSNIRPDMEIPEEERGQTPEAMKYPLYPHQQLALRWMTGMEENENFKGGILADDMGLGKTISTLALMISRPSTNPSIKTNLIVGPVSLIKQWESEVKKKLKVSHKMSVYLLHQKRKMSYAEIKKYDVVLTTYGSIASEWKRYMKHIEERIESPEYRPEADVELAKKCPILHPKSVFYRIILDEAQCIKNKDTQGSKGASSIIATYRWCLTGTPMMNSVSELFPLIRFLRIRPYNDAKAFQRVCVYLFQICTVFLLIL